MSFYLFAGLLTLAPPARAEEPASAIAIKVMSFNIWYGGEQVSFPKVVEAIQRAGADIVGVQEPDSFLDKLAVATGLTYVDHRRNILSRYPLFDPKLGERTEQGSSSYGAVSLDADALYDWVMVRPGKVVAMANTHLTSDPYGPDYSWRGASVSDLLALEARLRVPDARPFMALAKIASRGVPVFMTGDFNSPSPLDWTPAAAAARHLPYSFRWPAMSLLLGSGLRDSYREAYPDAVARPGFTWTAGQPNPYVRPQEHPDRIDFVLTAGPTRTLASEIVGEAGGPNVDLAIAPYPSDHRAVVSTFSVVPADAPPLVAVEPTRIEQGDNFMVRGYLPGSDDFSLLVVPRGGGVAEALIGLVDEQRGYRTGVRLSTVELAPGRYDAILVRPADKSVAARTRFTIVAAGTRPRLVIAAPEVAPGAAVQVHWSGAPGNRFDWIGLYRSGDPDMQGSLVNTYTNALVDGDARIGLLRDGTPLPVGHYVARLLRDDSNVVLASAPFTIRAP